jgi:hypothetical protein
MDIQLIILIAVASAILLLTVALLLVRRTVMATIAGFSWQRKVFLEHFIWVEEDSTWGYPKGSRNQRSEMESYQSYELLRHDTITTTDANGNTTTTSQPVYGFVTRSRIRYRYEIQKWRRSRIKVAEGNDHIAHWPLYTLDKSTQERIEKTKENYQVCFQTPKGKTYQRKLPESEWAALDEQTTYKLRVTLYGGVTDYVPEQQSMVMSAQQRP